MSGILIEGVCASGKTTIMKELTKRDWYVEKQTKIQLNEYLTERIVENIGATVDKRVELLQDYVDIFEKVYSNFYNSRFKCTNLEEVKPFFLAERFHLTHAVESDAFEEFETIDNRLKAMDIKLVILTMDKDVIKNRIEDTFPRRPETWKKYCLSFGSMDQVAERYWLMQEKLLNFAKRTKLDTIIINTSGAQWNKYILEIEKFITIKS